MRYHAEVTSHAGPRAIVFDLDGTLIDSRDDIVAAAQFALAHHRIRCPAADVIAGFVGDGARLLISRALEQAPDSPRVDAVLATFIAHYTANPIGTTKLFDGAKSCLRELRLPLAVCTNKPYEITSRILEALEVADRFSIVVGGDTYPERKPHGRPLLEIAKHLSCSPQSLVMVGDGPQDIESGRVVGAATVGVRGGLSPIERLEAAAPDFLLNDLAELPELIESMGRVQPG